MMIPDGYVHLDALLAWAVAARDGLPPPLSADAIVPIEIPVEHETGGRFHLASASIMVPEARATIHLQRRFPTAEAGRMTTMRRVNLAAGPQKNYRIPMEVTYAAGGEVTWYALGEQRTIEELLSLVTHLGKKRSAGHGIIRGWRMEPCETWPGFPTLAADGAALRHLPINWPGLGTHRRQIGRLTYPYWTFREETEVAAPMVA